MVPFTAYLRCVFRPSGDAPEVSLNRLAGMFDHWFRKSLPREPHVTKVTPLRRQPGTQPREVAYDLMVVGEAPTEGDPAFMDELRARFVEACAPEKLDRLDPDKNPDLLVLRLQEVLPLTGQRTQLKVAFRAETGDLKRLPSPNDLLKVGQLQDANGFWLWDVCFDLTTWKEGCEEAAYLLTLSELSNTPGDRSADVNPWAETLLTRLGSESATHALTAATGQPVRCVSVVRA